MLHPIVRACSGGECMRLLRSSLTNQPRPDAQQVLAPLPLPLLTLLDLNTSGDDGRDVLREVRSDVALRTLPMVLLSASASARDLQFCYAHGANAYHVKPVNHAMHLKLLQTIFAYWLGSVVLPT
jgi:CheY-like chemotaxis protein